MITHEDVRYIASLSRIYLKDDEMEMLTKNLERILQYIDQLKKLDVEHIPPTSHVLPLKNVYRDDTVRPSLSQTETLKMAVEHHNGSFKVPKVIE